MKSIIANLTQLSCTGSKVCFRRDNIIQVEKGKQGVCSYCVPVKTEYYRENDKYCKTNIHYQLSLCLSDEHKTAPSIVQATLYFRVCFGLSSTRELPFG